MYETIPSKHHVQVITIWMQQRLRVSLVIKNARYVNGIKHKYSLQWKGIDMYYTIYLSGIETYPVHRELLYQISLLNPNISKYD